MRALLVLLCVMALPAVSPAARADTAGTTVAVDGANVTITVHLELCCLQDAAEQTIFGPLVQVEVNAAQDMWNEALAKLPAKGCYNIKVVFDVRLLKQGEPWDPGYHHIAIDFSHPGRSFSNDPRMKSANDDTDTVIRQVVDGQFYESDMSIGTWAHEIGHLMGLGDDYYHEHGLGHAEGACLPGRDNTLMCRSRTGSIDQNLADRLADILNITDRLPQCWTGPMHSDSTGKHGAGAVCTGEGWDHQVQFIVGSDNQVKGTATSRRVAMPSCVGPGSWATAVLSREATAARFDIAGQLHGLDFELRFSETFIDGGTAGLINYSLGLAFTGPTLKLPLTTFETARWVVETNVSLPGGNGRSATGRHSFDLKCASCGRSPRPM